jgi:hypothetical protein
VNESCFFHALKFLCKKKPGQFLSQSFEEMQVHKVLRKNCCPTFNFPAKKLHVIVVVRLIYVICTKDGGGGALAHTYYSVAAWPV